MDKVSRHIQEVVNKEITEPKGFENAIKTALYSDKFNRMVKKRRWIKGIAFSVIACCAIVCILLLGFLMI